MSVCYSHIWRKVHPIYFTLGGCVAKDSRKCSVEFGAVSTRDTFKIKGELRSFEDRNLNQKRNIHSLTDFFSARTKQINILLFP